MISSATSFDATGKLQIGPLPIRDDHAEARRLSVSEIFMYSSNIGMARWCSPPAARPLLEAFFRKVGFYGPPAIEIDGAGRPRVPKRWPDVTAATTSFGHGISSRRCSSSMPRRPIVRDGTWIAPSRSLPSARRRHLPPRERMVSEQTARCCAC